MDENLDPQNPVEGSSVPQSQPVPQPEAPEASPAPVSLSEPIQGQVPEQPAQPVYQAPTAQDQFQSAAYPSNNQMYGSSQGYVSGVKSVFSQPENLINSLSQNLVKAIIFVAINLGIFSAMTIVVAILGVMKANSIAEKLSSSYSEPTLIEMNGEFWGGLFKGIGLSALYSIGFLFLLASVVYVLSMIGQKQADFNKSFGLTSILSLNFLAGALSLALGLIALYATDLSEFIGILTASVTAIAFVYTSFLLIKGIVENIGLSYFVAVSTFVVTVVLGTFIMGKMIKNFGSYFNVSFGYFGTKDASSLISEMTTKLNEAEDYLNDLDFSY